MSTSANLVVNGDFELGTSHYSAIPGTGHGWVPVSGSGFVYNDGTSTYPAPHGGTWYASAGDDASSEMRQDIDVSGYATEIDAGEASCSFACWVQTFLQTPQDTIRVIVEFRDGGGAVLESYDTGAVSTSNVWTEKTNARTIAATTRTVRIRVIGTRNNGTSNDSYIDDVTFFVHTPDGSIPTGTIETFADHAARTSAPRRKWITIEGVGDADGLYRFCEAVPSFARGDSVWKPLLSQCDPPLPEAPEAGGGRERAGELTFALLDRANEITALFKIDTRPTAILAAALGRLDVFATVSSASNLVEGRVVYFGREAVRILSIDGTEIELEREILDTEAEHHPAGELIYSALPTIEGRKVRLWFGADDGRTGIPMPANNAIETLDNGFRDAISMRLDGSGGNPVDSSRNGRDATAASGFSDSLSGPTGPNWIAADLSGSGSYITLPKFNPGDSFVAIIGFRHDAIVAGTTQTLVAFTRDNATDQELFTVRIPGAANDVAIALVNATPQIVFDLPAPLAEREWHLLEVQILDLGSGVGSRVRTFLDGTEVDLTDVAERVADQSWTDATANTPRLGADVDVGGGMNEHYAGLLAPFRIISEASGPYHAKERWRAFQAMTPAQVEWGLYRLEPPALSDDLNEWELTAKSENAGTNAVIGRRRADGATIERYFPDSRIIWIQEFDSPETPPEPLFDASSLFLRVDDAVLQVSSAASGSPYILAVDAFGIAGSTPRPDIGEGSRASYVYVADRAASGSSFRYSPGASLGGGTPSEDRASGTWVQTAHWIPLMLSVLTSSADDDDGLELTNYNRDVGNFAVLPPGVGAGYPWHRIDWDAWLDVWKRTPGWTFDGLVVGHETLTFGEWVDREFLRPLGAFLDEHQGKVSILLPRLPRYGDTLLPLGPSNVLHRKIGRGRALPEMRFRKTSDRTRTSVAFNVRGRDGQRVKVQVNDSALRGLYGSRRQLLPFVSEEIDVPSVLVQENGTVPWLEALAARYLFYTRRSAWEIKAKAFWELESVRRGEFLAISHDEFPNLETGERGIESIPARVEQRQPVDRSGEPSHLALKLTMFGVDMRVGRIAPSGIVTAVSGAGPYVATIEANRYTAPNGPSDLPTRDVLAFANGDVLRLTSRAGASLSGSTATVQANPEADGANTLRLSGNFGGALAAGTVLEYASRANQIAQQYNAFVTAADAATRTIGATTDRAWQYAGE